MKNNRTAVTTLSLLIVLYAGLSFFMSSIIEEDAFIYFRCAENILQGNGYVFNPGGEHIEACSSVTWLFTLVVVGWLGFNIIISAKVLGILCGAVSLILIYKIMEAFTDEMPWVMVPSFLTLVTPPFIMWNQMGLETALYSVILLWLISVSLNEASCFKYWPAVAALLITTRPEGFFLLLGLIPAFCVYRHKKKALRYSCAAFFVIALLLFLLRFFYFHDFFPTPFYLKIGPSQYYEYVSYMHRCFRDYYLYYFFIPLAFFFFKKENWKGKRFILLGFIITYLLWVVRAGADYKPLYRHLIPLFPLFYIYIISGMVNLSGQPSFKKQVIATSFIFLFTSAVFLFSPIKWYLDEDPLPNFFLSKIQQFAREPQRYIALCFKRMTEPATYDYNDQRDCQVLLGKFVKRNYKSGSTIVYDQMGRVPYFAGTNINFIDSVGLTDKVIGRARFYYKSQRSPLLRFYEIISRNIIKTVYPEHSTFSFTKEALMNYVFEKNPEVIMCFVIMRPPVISFLARTAGLSITIS